MAIKIDNKKIEETFNCLNEQEKQQYLQKYNTLNKTFLIISSIMLPILIAATVYLVYICISSNDTGLLAVLIVILIVLYAVEIFLLLVPSIKALKLNDEEKIKKYIEILEKRKANANETKNNMKLKFLGQFDTSNIKSVIILDSYTEMSDKLHAVLNYQEIIQTRYYKFRVNYFDGSSKIITAKEDSPEYNALIGFVGQDTSNNTPNSPNVDNADLILKYKKLLDEGIITQEEFDRKKKELL